MNGESLFSRKRSSIILPLDKYLKAILLRIPVARGQSDFEDVKLKY